MAIVILGTAGGTGTGTATAAGHYVRFFADRAEAGQWTSEHDGTFVISLADGAEIARLANAARFPTIR